MQPAMRPDDQQTTIARVAIIGGGISGLSAAWYLQQGAQTSGINLSYTVFESADRWGGKVLTEQVDGAFIVEAGPDSFLTQKPWALALARELGLDADLLGTNDRRRNVYVLHKGKPVVLPDGVLLIVPTKFTPFALSPLISPLGKLRMGLDLLIPPKRDNADETLADFIRRRLGSEALDKIAEPLMAGIYNAESERQSLLATFPRFRQIEQEHGSLIRGMIASRRKQAASPNGSALNPPISMFMSLKGGTEELITALVQHLSDDLRLRVGVQRIERVESGGYRLTLADGQSEAFDAVIIATPAYVAADLVRPLAPAAADKLASIRYVSTGTISLAYRESDIRCPLNGFGLVVPQSERRPINAITISSIKFNRRAPDGQVLLRVFFGGSRSPQSMTLDDDALLRMVTNELRAILSIEVPPLFHRIYRWHRANPQYDLNHLALVDSIESALPPGLYVIGGAYRGVGMPDCVYQAQQTAGRIIAETQTRAVTQ